MKSIVYIHCLEKQTKILKAKHRLLQCMISLLINNNWEHSCSLEGLAWVLAGLKSPLCPAACWVTLSQWVTFDTSLLLFLAGKDNGDISKQLPPLLLSLGACGRWASRDRSNDMVGALMLLCCLPWKDRDMSNWPLHLLLSVKTHQLWQVSSNRQEWWGTPLKAGSKSRESPGGRPRGICSVPICLPTPAATPCSSAYHLSSHVGSTGG